MKRSSCRVLVLVESDAKLKCSDFYTVGLFVTTTIRCYSAVNQSVQDKYTCFDLSAAPFIPDPSCSSLSMTSLIPLHCLHYPCRNMSQDRASAMDPYTVVQSSHSDRFSSLNRKSKQVFCFEFYFIHLFYRFENLRVHFVTSSLVPQLADAS